jgi:hypothetical protein
MCPHTTSCGCILLYVSACLLCRWQFGRILYICVLILLCPHTTMSMSDIYYTICVRMLVVQVAIWPHTLYMCPHTTICVLVLLYVSSYYVCVLIHQYVSSYYYMCPHPVSSYSIYVSSYHYMCPHTLCVLILLFSFLSLWEGGAHADVC